MAKYGYYQPYFIVGAAITAISGGLVYTLDIDTSVGKQAGYQILMGLGTGLVLQIPPIIAGVVTSNADKAIGLAAVLGESRSYPWFFKKVPTTNPTTVTQFYAASLVLAASSAITNNLLLKNLPIHAPSVNAQEVFTTGAYDLQNHFNGTELRGIREAYVVGLHGAWAMGIALFGMAFLAAFLAKWPGKMEPHSDLAENQKSAKASGLGEKVEPGVEV